VCRCGETTTFQNLSPDILEIFFGFRRVCRRGLVTVVIIDSSQRYCVMYVMFKRNVCLCQYFVQLILLFTFGVFCVLSFINLLSFLIVQTQDVFSYAPSYFPQKPFIQKTMNLK
jgi:hypothetical protein